MGTQESILRLIEELEKYSKDELEAVYAQEKLLREKEKKLIRVEQKLSDIKSEIAKKQSFSKIESFEKIGELKKIIEEIKKGKEEILKAIKPIDYNILEGLELEKYSDILDTIE